MTAGPAVAPEAPGRPGEVLGTEQIRDFLERLDTWRDSRRRELDQLDAAALAAAVPDLHTADVVLSMALWKAVADRHDALLAVWDSGRVGRGERERLSQLVHRRLDPGAAGGVPLSLPEACRLSDALAGQLRARLALDPVTADVTARLREARAQVERIRDLVTAAPGPVADGARQLRRLDTRLAEITDRARRGADVAGPLAVAEEEASRTERDLIVAVARGQQAARDHGRAMHLRAALEGRESDLAELVRRCVASVRPAPRHAVPDVSALGPVPEDPDTLASYLERLERVGRALRVAEDAYGAALARRDELQGRLEAYAAMAVATGRGGEPATREALGAARAVLATPPVDLDLAEDLVTRYQALIRRPADPAHGRTA